MCTTNELTLSSQIISAYEIIYKALKNILDNLNKIIVLTTLKSECPIEIQIQIANEIQKIEQQVLEQQKLKIKMTKRIERIRQTKKTPKIRHSRRIRVRMTCESEQFQTRKIK